MKSEPKRSAKFSGKALQRAREWRGVTVMKLSQLSGVSRESITSLERGDALHPTLTTIWRLAEPLDVQPQFFEVVPGTPPSLDSFHLRSTVRAPAQYHLKRLAAKAELFDRITRTLERYVDFPEDSVPRKSVSSFDEIEDAASTCRRQFGLSRDAPVKNLTRVLERSGCLVSFYADEYTKTEAFCWESWRPLIFANMTTADGPPPQTTRVRGALAHELGHIVMHRGSPPRDKNVEAEAWHFAHSFLLPRSALLSALPKMTTHLDWSAIWSVKEKWGVPASFVVFAATAAHLISPQLSKRFFSQMGRRGEMKRESHEPTAFQEKPEITNNVSRALESEIGITATEIATEVGLTPEQATEVSGIQMQRPSNVIPFLPSHVLG